LEVLIDLVLFTYRYLLQFQEPIPCEQVVSSLCDMKQAYTQFGGKYQTLGTGATIKNFLLQTSLFIQYWQNPYIRLNLGLFLI